MHTASGFALPRLLPSGSRGRSRIGFALDQPEEWSRECSYRRRLQLGALAAPAPEHGCITKGPAGVWSRFRFISLLSSGTQLFQQRNGSRFDNPITESEVLLAIMHVLTDYFIQGINVIEIHVVEALNVRVNISWNGDINEEQGAIPAHQHDLPHVLTIQQGIRTARRSHDDIRAGHCGEAIIEPHGLAAEFRGQLEGALERTIGNKNRAGAFLGQMTDAGFTHLAGADNEHRLAGQSVRKNLLGEFHRYTADGGGAAADKRASAALLRHVECLLEDTVQNAACELRRTGELVSFFDLSGDFRLAKHH